MPPPALDPATRWAIAACFFLSGAAGLIYEVVWAKHLALFIGSTGLSHTIILASFMGGLALGSWVLGRVCDNFAHPLRAYAVLELGIGCYGIFYPSFSSVMEWVYLQAAEGAGISGAPGLALKLLLSAIVLVPPTFLMGGTLPLLGRFLAQPGNPARAVSLLYFLNSFGAVAGTLAGGFLLIPDLGLR
ncbi:MAG: fused MFS/spermidine synthase, partial [Thermoanaerobaculia bacterium]